MSRRIVGIVLVLLLAVVATACQKLPDRTGGEGGLPRETIVKSDVIPADWGNLVGVSGVGAFPDLVQLWFQDAGGNIRLVVYRVPTAEILNARIIRRG